MAKGCNVHPLVGFLVVFAVAAVVGIAVGLGVYYGTRQDTSTDNTSTDNPSTDNTSTTTTTAAPTVPPLLRDVRLPTDLLPTHYNVMIRPDFTDPDPDKFRFTGTVQMFLTTLNATDVIVMHVKMLTVDETQIVVRSVGSGATVQVRSVSQDTRREFYKIHLSTHLVKDSEYSVFLNFSGPLLPDLVGIYYSFYTVSGTKRYLVTSQMEPTDARKVFPCFDEPEMKATFNVTIIRPATMTSLSNTVIYQTTSVAGWFADHYTTTPKMSTYLLAFVVSDFQCLSTSTSKGVVVKVCARPNAIDQARFALNISAPLQEYYETYHNISYPLPQMVHLAVPDFSAGAMENWGLIIYRETALLLDPLASSASAKQRVATVIAHELAHQWFGNLVSPSWWDDLWLNEGFASYMEYLSLISIFPDWDLESQFLPLDLHPVFRDDGLTTSHPIYQEVYNPEEINELFDSISYSKGASVIRMMKYFLGDKIFQDGLSAYLKSRAYQNAHHEHLFDALSAEADKQGMHIDVKEVMFTWIRQMGYPVVKMEYNSVTGDVNCTQKHFLLNPNANMTVVSPYNYKWNVPLSVQDEFGDYDTHYTKSWMNKTDTATLRVSPNASWIIGNVRQTYYYRVNYAESVWSRLITELTINHTIFHRQNRAQMIDDAFNLGRSGELVQTMALDVTQYLNNEMDYVPWTAASSNINYMSRMLVFTSMYPLLEKYMQKQVHSVYEYVGWNDNVQNDPHIIQLTRGTVLALACRFSKPECLYNASLLFDNWMRWYPANNATVSVNVRSVVYCYGIQSGSIRQWQFAFNQYNTSNVGTERSTILSALACAREAYILSDYLDMALFGTDIRLQDFSSVFINVARNRNGRKLAWSFMRLNWDTFIAKFGTSSFTLSNMVAGVTESFSTNQDLTELEAFIAVNPGRLGSAARAFQQAVEGTRTNIAWRAKNEASIGAWLETHA